MNDDQTRVVVPLVKRAENSRPKEVGGGGGRAETKEWGGQQGRQTGLLHRAKENENQAEKEHRGPWVRSKGGGGTGEGRDTGKRAESKTCR